MGTSLGGFLGMCAGGIIADSVLKEDWINYPLYTQLLGGCLISKGEVVCSLATYYLVLLPLVLV